MRSRGSIFGHFQGLGRLEESFAEPPYLAGWVQVSGKHLHCEIIGRVATGGAADAVWCVAGLPLGAPTDEGRPVSGAALTYHRM